MKPVKPILDWKTVGRMVPWDVVFLIGGGFALAEGSVVIYTYRVLITTI